MTLWPRRRLVDSHVDAVAGERMCHTSLNTARTSVPITFGIRIGMKIAEGGCAAEVVHALDVTRPYECLTWDRGAKE